MQYMLYPTTISSFSERRYKLTIMITIRIIIAPDSIFIMIILAIGLPKSCSGEDMMVMYLSGEVEMCIFHMGSN